MIRKKDDAMMRRMFLAVGIVLIVGVGFAFFQFDVNPITGFISYESYRQTVDLDLSEGTIYILSSSTPETLNITSFAISGEIIGDGQIEVYLQSANERILVFSNTKDKDFGIQSITGQGEGGLGVITGLVVGETVGTGETEGIEEANLLVLKRQPDKIDLQHPTIGEDNSVFSGAFTNVADDSQFIFMQLSQEDVIRMVINIEPGTRVRIGEILYTIQEE